MPTPYLADDILSQIVRFASASEQSTYRTFATLSRGYSALATKRLYDHPNVTTIAGLQAFLSALRSSPKKLKGLIHALALNHLELVDTACRSAAPADKHADKYRKAWTELCEVLPKLTNLRALALFTAAVKAILHSTNPIPEDRLDGPWCYMPDETMPLSRIGSPLSLDRLVLTGPEDDQACLFAYLQTRRLILFGCEHAWSTHAFAQTVVHARQSSKKKGKNSNNVARPFDSKPPPRIGPAPRSSTLFTSREGRN